MLVYGSAMGDFSTTLCHSRRIKGVINILNKDISKNEVFDSGCSGLHTAHPGPVEDISSGTV